jgi:hypothetical protein
MDATDQAEQPVRGVKRGRPAKVVEAVTETNDAAQSLALRIWAGQSPDVSVIERVARIAAALKDQGFGLDVTLPHPDAARYMEAHK